MEKLYLINRILILIIFLSNTGCSSKAQQMKHSEMKEVVAVQFEKWKNGEANFFELLADDVVWTVSGRSPVSGTYHGKTDFLERAVKPITEKLKTPLKPELVSLSSGSSYVWLHFKARATTKNDEVYENTYVWKMQLKNGKITHGIAFLDTYELTAEQAE